MAIGVLCSAACAPAVNRHYLRLAARHHGRPPAEARLVPMMASCWCIPAGLLIFAWTSCGDVHWSGPALGGFPVGFGFIFLYNAANNYLVDSYQHRAASALAAKTCIRSFWGAAVVLFTEQMYDRLGDQWASTLLAAIGLLCCGIPFLFWRYGARIRARSRFAYSGDDEETGADGEAGKGHAAHAGPLRREEQDDDLRRARSYVSNP
ncbi:Major facilitator superfamily multidrug transporter NAG3 like protein [Verticillium longisporum]|nr:Major facilitator superfamily multidrug transporter NAG3 like protein [Verticillium longisporum]